MKLFAQTFLLVGCLISCTPESRNSEEAKSQSNALIIQADFAGLVMAGVAYSVSPELDIFNIRPLIPLYDIQAASASLEYNSQSWPPGTVFVSVVDPGVGTSRKSVVLKTKNGQYFVSPDNGSLSAVANIYGIEAVREIDESVNRIEGSQWSHTFHGRDVYSFAGARLASGVISFGEVGPLLEPKVILLEKPDAYLEGNTLHGVVTGGAGRLGNVSFNIDRHLFAQLDPSYSNIFRVTIIHDDEVAWGGDLAYVRSFGDVLVGENLLFVNSSGEMSLAINQGQFASKYGISSGNDWIVEISKK